MILGLGVDLVEVARFERAVARQGEHFLQGFLRPTEIERSRAAGDPYPFYALAFATKEALFKALGTGRSGPVRWQDVEVRFHPTRPTGAWTGELGREAGRAGEPAFPAGEGAGFMLGLTGGTERSVLELGARWIHLSGACPSGRLGARLALACVILESGEPPE